MERAERGGEGEAAAETEPIALPGRSMARGAVARREYETPTFGITRPFKIRGIGTRERGPRRRSDPRRAGRDGRHGKEAEKSAAGHNVFLSDPAQGGVQPGDLVPRGL